MSSFSPIGSQEHLSSESFWPSFTDIMMVVVMIFLFASSILIVRNYHLVAELHESLAAEKRAEEVIESTSLENANLEIRLQTVESEISSATKENATLEERLANYEYQNSLLQLQIIAKNEKLKQINIQNQLLLAENNTKEQEISDLKVNVRKSELIIASLEEKIVAQTDKTEALSGVNTELENTKNQLELNVSQLSLTNADLNDINTTLIRENNELKQEVELLKASQIERNSELENLLLSVHDSKNQLELLRVEKENADAALALAKADQLKYNEELAELQADYDSVQEKYQKLIKPARSDKGKYVAEVHYVKKGDQISIGFKEPKDAEYAPFTLAEVEVKLQALKEKYGKDLYVRIVIPENSGLSYNEAWSFMINLLDKYDYYYQK